ncbi:hypothetical protein COJ11_32335 [Bacillus cereus]|uniref:hypothetical protein n=1 Tax=Bacillus cereus TaxID=1396 RepID=UPI000BF521AD|nr:hypothetical protein [Bacillus cereus]PFJ84005.1 hypothetical protein COJ11_32335 [Bacillus cereus]PGO63117.1 hypothetical protein CN983_28370 [Bacillus cereus]
MFVNVIAHTVAKMQLASIRDYIHEMEKTNTLKLEELSRASEEEAKKLTDEEQEMYWDHAMDEFHNLEKTFPSLWRYSTIVLTYSTIEQYLVRVVRPHLANALGYEDIMELNKNFKREFNKFGYQGHFLRRLGLYMCEKMDIQFPFDCKEWEFIDDLNTIRNNIVHCNGRVYDDQKVEEIKKAINSYETINISDSGEIVIKQDFIIHMINQVEAFLSLVFESVNQKK